MVHGKVIFNMEYCAFIGLLGTLSFFTVGTKSGPPSNVEKFVSIIIRIYGNIFTDIAIILIVFIIIVPFVIIIDNKNEGGLFPLISCNVIIT